MENEARIVLEKAIKHYESYFGDEEIVIKHSTKEIKKSKTYQILYSAKIKRLKKALKRLDGNLGIK